VLMNWQPTLLGPTHGPVQPVPAGHDGSRTGCDHRTLSAHGGAAAGGELADYV
jgi:hypothetical protein